MTASIQLFLGPWAWREGVHTFMEMLQCERLNLQLVYTLLDIVVEEVLAADGKGTSTEASKGKTR